MSPVSRSAILGLLLGLVLLPGCVQEMANQPRIDPLEPSAFFPDGSGARPQVPGTIARGQLYADNAATTGREDGEPVQTIPIEVSAGLLAEGRKQYGIYCDHCHGSAGYGDGMVVQRGFPHPPTYYSERLLNVPDGHLFAVITDGLGRMPGYKARIEPQDRWAIVAYVRALQLSQHADASELPADLRNELTATDE
ncbi:MAG: cytochrome c [Planctomycetota bacterium]|nr:MAG: cytochrome c [Planctomycetota bacterium]REJ88226.1 MAG: cytochrome c [Planctomycetota bacterium]REK24495.1 MAG: cytochrome c [Planctomycetota bacterium]REK32456.1 MAG: cytochrome c [Planctomycetota bacterium]